MNHVMIDLETLGTTCDAPIVAIGAVQFDPAAGKTGENFYRRIDWDSAIKSRRVSGDTLKWWMKQPDGARMEIVKNGVSMDSALTEFSTYLSSLPVAGAGHQVWGNGATFDISMLEHAYTQYKIHTPWKFWNVRDCRTIEELAKGLLDKKDIPRAGTHHNALDDALYQCAYVSAMWQALRSQDLFG